MKKTLFSVLLTVAVISGPGAALASTDCSLGQCGNGNPAAISMPWGLTGGETPIVKPGTSFKDERGVSFECPWWFPAGCYDITKTQYYRIQRGYVR
jgi:hypothetical protein